jgi:hypothetical protein
MLHRTWHTRKLQLLNAGHQRQKIRAACTWLPATVLAACITLCRQELSWLWRIGLAAFDAQVTGLRDVIHNRANVNGSLVPLTILANHIVWPAAQQLKHNTRRKGKKRKDSF